MTDKGLVTDSLTLDVGYDRENCDSGKYRGPVHIDHYGRTVPKGTHGSTKLDNPTNLGSILISATTELFERIADKTLTVRRITIAAKSSLRLPPYEAMRMRLLPRAKITSKETESSCLKKARKC